MFDEVARLHELLELFLGPLYRYLVFTGCALPLFVLTGLVGWWSKLLEELWLVVVVEVLLSQVVPLPALAVPAACIVDGWVD